MHENKEIIQKTEENAGAVLENKDVVFLSFFFYKVDAISFFE